jgi:hypothetical protein
MFTPWTRSPLGLLGSIVLIHAWANGCLQQIAAKRFSTPLDVIAILLQGFVRHVLISDHWWMTASDDTPVTAGRYRESAPTPGSAS